MELIIDNGGVNIGDEDYAEVASALGIHQGNIGSDANILIKSDHIAAYTDDGTITVDTDIKSPTLGAVTINLTHRNALLRLAKEDAKVAEGNYLVGGKVYTNPTLVTLWAVISFGNNTAYMPLTAVNDDYLQAIVLTETLTGFKAVMQCGTGESAETFTLDLPFTSGTDTSAGTGLTLKPGTRHPLTLSISPSTTPSP